MKGARLHRYAPGNERHRFSVQSTEARRFSNPNFLDSFSGLLVRSHLAVTIFCTTKIHQAHVLALLPAARGLLAHIPMPGWAGGPPFRLLSCPTLRKTREEWGTHIKSTRWASSESDDSSGYTAPIYPTIRTGCPTLCGVCKGWARDSHRREPLGAITMSS
jgi:hypothetical protein